MKKSIFLLLIFSSFLLITGCKLLTPDYITGEWVGSDTNGNLIFKFTEDLNFSIDYYNEDGSTETLNGRYTTGKSSIKLTWTQEDDQLRSELLSYTMYQNSMDVTWKGSLLRLNKN